MTIRPAPWCSLCIALLVGACSSNPPATPTASTSTSATPGASAQRSAPPPAAAPTATQQSAPSARPIPAHLDPASAVSRERSIYFDYDSSSIRPEFNRLIELHSKYLSSHPELSIRVEGNCDERGGAEYNLALGQRRAQVVINAMKLLGARANQAEAVSWGEEKPRASGHDETAWAQNRRADIVYVTR